MISKYLICVLIYQISATHIMDNEIISNRKSIKSPAVQIQDELDILKLMNVSAKEQGVSAVDGPISNFPAYKFRLPYENVPLSNSSAVTSNMSSKSGFTVVFLYRQQKNNLGTLLSVNSPGKLTPWFQINSNSKTNTLNLKYILKGSPKRHQLDWNLPNRHRKSPLAAWIWVSVSLDFWTGTIRLDLDCQPSQFATMTARKTQSRIKIPKDSLVYFRQEPGRKKKFLGSMQVAKILPYVTDQRLWSCTHITDNPEPANIKPLI